jgi:hypothetical protein
MPRHDTMHLHSGYQEVIETLLWGLKEIGYDVTFALNAVHADVRNIVFCADSYSVATLKTFRPDTIIYNLEQSYPMFRSVEKLENVFLERRRESYAYIRKNFEVWDYSYLNVETMLTVDSIMPVKYVPIGFAPILQRIAKPQEQDIDVLIYGTPHSYRLDVFKKLCEEMLSCMFVSGFYGPARDELIGRSKIVLCLTGDEPESIFPIVRASYLLANRKLVISTNICPILHLETDMMNAVKFCPTEVIHSFCQYWLSNDSERLEAENNGFNIMSRRDIRDFLLAALA